MTLDTETFDEGIAPGGVRSKSEIKVLICYLYNSVSDKMSKEPILDAIMQDELANYFETSAAFEDLIANGNLKESGKIDNETAYELTENGKTIASQLDTTLAYTVKEKAYLCAVKLLAERKTARENKVEIVKNENGYDVVCKILGGDVILFSFTIYAPDYDQAKIIKTNFLSYPQTVYKTMLALMTKDKDNVGNALEELYGIL